MKKNKQFDSYKKYTINNTAFLARDDKDAELYKIIVMNKEVKNNGR